MTKEYVKNQIELKKEAWERRYEYFKKEVNTQYGSSTFERNLVQGLLTMMLLRDEILELEQVLSRIEAEESCGE